MLSASISQTISRPVQQPVWPRGDCPRRRPHIAAPGWRRRSSAQSRHDFSDGRRILAKAVVQYDRAGLEAGGAIGIDKNIFGAIDGADGRVLVGVTRDHCQLRPGNVYIVFA